MWSRVIYLVSVIVPACLFPFFFFFFALLPFAIEYLHMTKAKCSFYHIFLVSCTSDFSNNLSSNKMKSIRDNSVISLPSSPPALVCILFQSNSFRAGSPPLWVAGTCWWDAVIPVQVSPLSPDNLWAQTIHLWVGKKKSQSFLVDTLLNSFDPSL